MTAGVAPAPAPTPGPTALDTASGVTSTVAQGAGALGALGKAASAAPRPPQLADKVDLVGGIANSVGGLGSSIGGLAGEVASPSRRGRPSRGAAIGSAAGNIGGTILGGLLAALAISDERAKTDVKSGRKSVREFLDNLEPKTWQYKRPEHGQGRHVGVMAQRLERSEIGRRMMGPRTSDGLRTVDYSPTKFNPTVLAALADINGRLKKAGV